MPLTTEQENKMKIALEKEIAACRALVPSARKSFNHYKPIIVSTMNGKKRTEVLGRNKRVDELGNFKQSWARGVIFESREEAIRYAEATKQVRINECFKRAIEYGVNIS